MRRTSITISLLDEGCIVESGIREYAFNDVVEGLAFVAKQIKVATTLDYKIGSESQLLMEAVEKIKEKQK